MTREDARNILPILKAYAEGQTIQWRHRHTNEKWKDLKNNEKVCLPSNIWEYRIKENKKKEGLNEQRENS